MDACRVGALDVPEEEGECERVEGRGEGLLLCHFDERVALGEDGLGEWWGGGLSVGLFGEDSFFVERGGVVRCCCYGGVGGDEVRGGEEVFHLFLPGRCQSLPYLSMGRVSRRALP